jgi:hypothetical protein
MERELFVREAAQVFGINHPTIEVLHSGLIHNTYKVREGKRAIVLQHINTVVFTEPEKIIRNYQKVFDHLTKKNNLKIPASIPSIHDDFLWQDNAGQFWRATEFIPDSYVETSSISVSQTFKAAKSFGEFARAITELEPNTLEIGIPGFHDLSWRFEQFQKAVKQAASSRLTKAQYLIELALKREVLVNFYNDLKRQPEFKVRIMHHDCKISNILFHQETQNPICPIDLDTVMPGYYFSDIGDLIRSLAGSIGESSTDVQSLTIRKPYYDAIITGYCEGIGNAFTPLELKFIHHAGLLMIYMQGLRFLTDYLSGDIYYKVSYPEQNFDRSENQFKLLTKLEEFLLELGNTPLTF